MIATAGNRAENPELGTVVLVDVSRTGTMTPSPCVERMGSRNLVVKQPKPLSKQAPQPLRSQGPGTSLASAMLTPLEIEQLRQNKKEQLDFARKAFKIR